MIEEPEVDIDEVVKMIQEEADRHQSAFYGNDPKVKDYVGWLRGAARAIQALKPQKP